MMFPPMLRDELIRVQKEVLAAVIALDAASATMTRHAGSEHMARMLTAASDNGARVVVELAERIAKSNA